METNMRTFLLVPALLSLALVGAAAAPARADTTYHFSGASCQPERPSDRNLALVDGGGISNLDGVGFPAGINVVCPVSGTESSLQTQVELKARVFDGNSPNAFVGFWQLDNMGNGTIWWSSAKFACTAANGCLSDPLGFTGAAWLRWSNTVPGEVFGTASSFTTYSFRAIVPGRCNESCAGGLQSWVRAYWTTHVQR
jgi:hypothetical protein